MAAIIYFDVFTTDAANGLHAGCLTADTDVLKVYLTNTTPSVSTHTAYAAAGGGGLEEIAVATGYTAGGEDSTNVNSGNLSGVIGVGGTDIVWTAGATWGTFRYAVLYNSTAAGNKLIGYWDNGSAVNLVNTQQFTTDFLAGGYMFTFGG